MRYRIREHPKGVFTIEKSAFLFFWERVCGPNDEIFYEDQKRAVEAVKIFQARDHDNALKKQKRKELAQIDRVVWESE